MKTPSLLSYNRSLHPTDAVFSARMADGSFQPIAIQEKTILGTQSQYDKTGQSTPGGNPQRVECSTLPYESDVLEIQFHLSVTAMSLAPLSCDEPQWRKAAIAMAGAYRDSDGFRTLGHLYAANIANGRFAWKNRLFASEFTVTVCAGPETFTFDALQHDLNHIRATASLPDVRRLGDIIAAGLCGPQLARLTVTARLNMGFGAAVYPSQEFAGKDNDKEAVGKILFGIPYRGVPRCAAFHEQKIGAALRTIDIFHKGLAESVAAGTPLPVNPYAQDREAWQVVRSAGSGNANFFDLMKKGIEKTFPQQAADGKISDDFHVVMANLVRGGVFGYGSNKKEEKDQKEKGDGA